MIETNDVIEIQVKLKRQVEELEEKVRSSKISWNDEYKFDKHFVQNFIEGHYNEIVHHFNQIKHHLDRINHHKKEIEDIQMFLSRETDSSSPDIQNDSDDHSEDKSVKRSEDDKVRLKSRRVARSTSLKYVLQWEKMLDDQKDGDSINSVKRRSKDNKREESGDVKVKDDEERDVSKIMVKNRVLQFEGIQKPKRISSTYETFLDIDKSKRIQSFTIPEESEDEEKYERSKSCEPDISMDYLETSDNNLGDSKLNELSNSENLEHEKCGNNDENVNEEMRLTTSRLDHVKDEEEIGAKKEARLAERNENERALSATVTEEEPSKPRIIEVHLKPAVASEVNAHVPPV